MNIYQVCISVAVACGIITAVLIVPTDYIVLAVILAAIGYPVARMCVAEERDRPYR